MNVTAANMDWMVGAWAGMAVKGGLVLAFAGLAALLLHRKSAAWRHLAWTAALVGLPVLTLLSLAGPSWRLPVLQAPETALPTVTDGAPVAILQSASEPAVLSAPALSTEASHGTAVSVKVPGAAEAASSPGGISWVRWLLAGWAAAAGLVCLPLAVGLLSLVRVRRTALEPRDGYWTAALEEARRDIRLRREVLFLEHEHHTMPMTWGVLRPTVMLPVGARAWNAEKQRAVLLHELAHVRRHDYVTRMLARLGLALHVFNPLAWFAWRRMRTESERACDDRVLAAGADPADYADQLIQIAQHCLASPWSSASAITMARKSQLEGRILAVLDAARSRVGVSRGRVAAFLALTAVVLIPVSAVRLVANEQPLRHFTRVVVGQGAMTFQGEPVDWDTLAQRLAEVPDREHTVLEVAMATEDLTIATWNEAKARVLSLSRTHGFEYMSDIGLHELGTQGSAAEPREVTESNLSERRDKAVEDGSLIDALQAEMRRVELRGTTAHPYKDKVDLAGVWDDYRERYDPGPGEIRRLLAEVEQWGGPRRDEADYGWRVGHVLSAMARDAGDNDGAMKWMILALHAYPRTLYVEPSKHSKFQHLINEEAGLRWEEAGPDKAFTEAYGWFVEDPRFEYFFFSWWVKAAEEQDAERDIEELRGHVLRGYAERLERFPDRAALTHKYMSNLAGQTDERLIPADVRALLEEPEAPRMGALQALIDQAEPGATVEIPNGIHDEPLRVDKALTLRGTSRSQAMLKVKSDRPAIHVLTDEPVFIHDLTIEWQRASSKKVGHPQAAVVAGDGKLSIAHCEFSGEEGNERCPAALLVDGFADLDLRDCLFNGFNFTAQITGGAKALVEDCIFLNSGHCGLTALHGAELTVRRNLFTGSAFHGLRCTGGTLNAEDNLIVANKNRGIYLGNRAAHGLVRNNLIIANATGISVFGGSDVTIRNNVVADNTFAAIDARAQCPITVEANILTGNDQGFIVWEEGRASTTVNLGANTFWDNTSNAVLRIDMPEDAVLADPGFADSVAGDFSRPEASAPGADHGLADPEALRPVWDKWEAVRGSVGRSGG